MSLDEIDNMKILEDCDDCDSEDTWNQIIEIKQKQGYVDYSELVWLFK